MLVVRDDWIQTNIRERAKNRAADFVVSFKPTGFERRTFLEASARVAAAITARFGRVHFALSGGLDSCFAFERLVETGCTVTPVVVAIERNRSNALELRYALDLCRRYAIEPLLIEISEADHLAAYYEKLLRPMNTPGAFSVPVMLAAEIAERRCEILVTGEHMLGHINGVGPIGLMADFDVCADFSAEGLLCPFFLYDPSVSHAMFTELSRDPVVNEYEIKRLLYAAPPRQCLPNQYDDPEIRALYTKLYQARRHVPHFRCVLGSREEVLKTLNSWKI